jgi:hypothetical protein
MANKSQFLGIFKNEILSEDINLTPSLDVGQHLYFVSNAVSVVADSLSKDIEEISNNQFPSSSSSAYLYKQASSLGISTFDGATPTFIKIGLDIEEGTLSPISFTIPSGYIINNDLTGNEYSTISETSVAINEDLSLLTIDCVSTNSGISSNSPYKTLGTFKTPITITEELIVSKGHFKYVTSGIDAPTDLDLSIQVSKWMSSTYGSGSEGDYIKWIKKTEPTVSDIYFPSILSNTSSNTIYIAIGLGALDPKVNIELPYPVSSACPQYMIDNVFNFVETQRGINDNHEILSLDTFGFDSTTINYKSIGLLNPSISINVVLPVGITLNTTIIGENGDSKTVSEWIKYQFRFGVLSAKRGGIAKGENRYVANSDIVTIIKNGLGNDGYLCSCITDISFTYSDANIRNSYDIPVPNANQSLIQQDGVYSILYLYDIDTSIINIT